VTKEAGKELGLLTPELAPVVGGTDAEAGKDPMVAVPATHTAIAMVRENLFMVSSLVGVAQLYSGRFTV
jgi:hypothetical protein